jgi:hypothetical protein
MRLLGYYLRGALVWTTAASVLLAGFPHYQCRCPNGNLKLLCFGWAVGTGCCCSGACCPASAGQGGDRTSCTAPAKPAKKKKCCCCQDRSVPADQAAGAHTQATNAGCQKTVSPADFLAAPATAKVAPDSFAATFLLPPPQPLVLLSSDAGRPFTWASDRAPPPTDLVIALQHFVL